MQNPLLLLHSILLHLYCKWHIKQYNWCVVPFSVGSGTYLLTMAMYQQTFEPRFIFIRVNWMILVKKDTALPLLEMTCKMFCCSKLKNYFFFPFFLCCNVLCVGSAMIQLWLDARNWNSTDNSHNIFYADFQSQKFE